MINFEGIANNIAVSKYSATAPCQYITLLT